MYSRFSGIALRWARVSARPEPPIGEPGSVRTFRAGHNYYYVRLLRWGIGQIGAMIGILFSIEFTEGLQGYLDRGVAARNAPTVTASPSPESSTAAANSRTPVFASTTLPVRAETMSPSETPSPSPTQRRARIRSGSQAFNRAIAQMPAAVVSFAIHWFMPFLVLLEYLGVVAFLAQFPFTYALVRIEFEQHWYIVTDRSLRIRTGVFSLSESTMSYANIQQVEVKQGPLQRLLGLADLRVRSAGGGGDGAGEHEGEGLHTGVFHGVENAEEIRDLMLARLRAFREAGLGDPDHPPRRRCSETRGVSIETLEAAREVLRQTQALRIATGSE